VVVVPDGPRGPRETAKPGVVALAGMTGVPIVPVAVGASAEWRVASWDGLRIPKPGARLVVAFGEPLFVPRDAGPAERAAARKDLESSLAALGWRVDAQAAR